MAHSPFQALGAWLEQVEARLGDSRYLLLCLDEFERLEPSIRGGRLPPELMDQFRHIIQHHPHVVLLLAGSHRPDEMELDWPDALISTRLIRVSYLQEQEARQLITQPVPDFAISYSPQAVAHLLGATRGQPYLVQAVCYELVNHLNLEGRRHARPEDAAEAVSLALESTRLYFAEMWRQLDDLQRRALAALSRAPEGLPAAEVAHACSAHPDALAAELHTLELCSTIEQTPDRAAWRLQVPMVAQWVRLNSPGV